MTFIQNGMRTKTCTSEFTYTVCLVCNHFTILSKLIDYEHTELFTQCSFFITGFMSIKWCNFLLDHFVSGIMDLNLACKKGFIFQNGCSCRFYSSNLVKLNPITFILIKLKVIYHSPQNVCINLSL